MKKKTILYAILTAGMILTGCGGREAQLPEEEVTDMEGTETAADTEALADYAAGAGYEAPAHGALIEDQTFQAELEPLGKITFSSYEPDVSADPLADAVFTVTGENGVAQIMEGMFEGNVRANETFSQVEAVSFPDYNSDGWNDIIIICSYTPASGPDVGTGYSEARIYTGSETGEFHLEKELSAETNSALAELTIDSVMGFLNVGSGRSAEAGTTEADMGWKQAYIDFLSKVDTQAEGVAGYSLIYLDEDDIPELAEIGDCEAACSRILSYYNGEVKRSFLHRLGFTYLEKENLLCNSEGNMDVYSDAIYRLEQGELVYVTGGEYGAENNADLQFDENGEVIYNYYWNGMEMSKEEYETELEKAYDSSRAKEGYIWDGYDTRDAMIARLQEM